MTHAPAFAFAVAILGTAHEPAASELAPLPLCTQADAALVTKLDSATSVAGDAFTFKLLDRVPASARHPELTPGTRGYGVVAFADHAHGSGQPGRLVVEPRYLLLADGRRVQAIADPQLAEGFAQGATRNLNGALTFVPGIGLGVAGYNALHRGREISLERGTQFRVLIGDELATGECYVPPPSSPNVR